MLINFREFNAVLDKLTIDDIKSQINQTLSITKFKDKSSKSIAALVGPEHGSRVDVLQKIENLFKEYGAVYDPNKGSSSVGATVIGPYSVSAAPASKQGNKSAGIENEQIMIDQINAIVENGPMHIVFKSPRKSFIVNNVSRAVEVGRDTSGRKKSDVNLETTDGKLIPLSLKKDGAEMWESADSYYSERAKAIIDDLIDQGKAELIEKGAVFQIKPNIAVKASAKEARDVVFGSDLLSGKGAVLYRTWRGSDFIIEDDKIVINTTKIYTSPNEVEKGDHAVYFLIRNDSSRKGSKIYPGIRVLAVGKSRVNRRVLVVQ